jgi:hypothetical protein
MSHTETVWIIVGLGTFAGTMGLLVGLREIIYRAHRTPIHNRLRRAHGDIELNQLNQIEPIQPEHAYHPLDEVNPNYMNYETYNWGERVSSFWRDRVPTYYSGQPAPSYYSGGNPPSFNTIDRGFINCSFEDNINLDYILWLILFLILALILKKLSFRFFKKNENIVFTKGISTNEITFTTDYQELLRCRLGDGLSYDIIYKNTYYHILNPYFTLFDIIEFLKSLDEADYAITFELISKTSDGLFLNYPRIILSKEFMLNKCSDPVLISRLLSTELENIYRMFDAEDNEKHYIRIQYTHLTASQ